MATKRKLTCYSLSKKIEILAAMDKKELTRKEIMAKYQLPSSTLSTFLSKRKEIEAAYIKTNPNRKRLRPTNREEMEEKVYEWFKYARCTNLPVSGAILMGKSVTLSEEMGGRLHLKQWMAG